MVKYTEEQIEFMKVSISRVGRGIPTDILDYIWNTYKEISGNLKEPQPCRSGCPKAGALWNKACNTIAAYLDDLEGNETI